ncbi:MAG: N-acetyltransferase [Deltaproteobacteria bacterium]|nr:N-acetyltransferase [Deltaproteobacteria bacterium]
MTNSPFIHESTVVDAPVQIGCGTRIWHFCHLMKGCVIGENCVLGQNVYVASQVVIGNGVRIQNNVSLYDGLSIGDDVFIGPGAVFTNVKNPRAHRNQKANFRPTRIERGATVGANATIVCGATIGEYAFVGAGALITKDVPPHGLMLGVPAQLTAWVCRCGEKLTQGSTCDVCTWTCQ